MRRNAVSVVCGAGLLIDGSLPADVGGRVFTRRRAMDINPLCGAPRANEP